MDKEKRKNLIGSMLLYCLAGDLAIRINYGGILISRIENYLIEEVVLKDANHSYLTNIISSIDSVITAALLTRKDELLPLDDNKLRELVITRTFPIDASWLSEESRKGVIAIGDLSDIRTARSHYYSALDSYSQSGKNSSEYSASIKSMDRAMQIIVNICERYDLFSFGGNEWRANITTTKEA